MFMCNYSPKIGLFITTFLRASRGKTSISAKAFFRLFSHLSRILDQNLTNANPTNNLNLQTYGLSARLSHFLAATVMKPRRYTRTTKPLFSFFWTPYWRHGDVLLKQKAKSLYPN